MTGIHPAFVPVDSPFIYRTWTHGLRFDAPVTADNDSREVVAFSGHDTVKMRPLPRECCCPLHAAQELAGYLESNARRVSDMLLACEEWRHGLLCIYAVMAWHLIDSDASLTHLYISFKMNDLMDLDIVAWTVLAVFRNMWALRELLSKEAIYLYTKCTHQITGTLHAHDYTVDVSPYPE